MKEVSTNRKTKTFQVQAEIKSFYMLNFNQCPKKNVTHQVNKYQVLWDGERPTHFGSSPNPECSF